MIVYPAFTFLLNLLAYAPNDFVPSSADLGREFNLFLSSILIRAIAKSNKTKTS